MALVAGGTGIAGAGTPHGTASPAAVAQAKAITASQQKPITINYKPGKLPGSVAGKKVIHVSNQTGGGQQSIGLAAAPAKILGINFQAISIGATSEDVSNAFSQIVASDSSLDGLMVNAYAPSSWMPQFEALEAAHIPMVFNAVPCGPWDSYKLLINVEGTCSGVAQASATLADWIIAKSNGHPGNAVAFTSPGLPILTAASGAFISKYKELCPTCSLATQSVALTTIGTTLPATTVAYLQAHPTVKYVFMTFGDMMIGVPAAVKAAGITGVKFTTQSAAPTDVGYVAAGEEAAVAAYPQVFVNDVEVDAIARLMLKANVSAAKNWKFPTELMTIANVSTFPAATGFASTPGLSSYFNKLWNK
jgi:ribose transport system substrate-binding protein